MGSLEGGPQSWPRWPPSERGVPSSLSSLFIFGQRQAMEGLCGSQPSEGRVSLCLPPPAPRPVTHGLPVCVLGLDGGQQLPWPSGRKHGVGGERSPDRQETAFQRWGWVSGMTNYFQHRAVFHPGPRLPGTALWSELPLPLLPPIAVRPARSLRPAFPVPPAFLETLRPLVTQAVSQEELLCPRPAPRRALRGLGKTQAALLGDQGPGTPARCPCLFPGRLTWQPDPVLGQPCP